MNAIDKNFLLNHGFIEDTDKKILSGLFSNNKKFKEVNLTVNLTEPFMLLARSIEKNVAVYINSVQENRLILKKSDKCKTVIMNVVLDEISNCLFKDYGNGLFEFKYEVRGLTYSLHILL